MKRHVGFTKAQRQAEWLAAFSDAVVTLDARHAGRIDWATAQHFYFTGLEARVAAERYVASRGDA